MIRTGILFAFTGVIMAAAFAHADKPRARDLGVPFDGTPGKLNAITDVKGVAVGHVTLIEGKGKLEVGKGPIRTGVTAVLPRGKKDFDPCFAGFYSHNGNGEMTGTPWVEESGFLEGPVLITNTHSVGVVRDAAIKWFIENSPSKQPWLLPVVAETYDGHLNDINGFHVKRKHTFEAIDKAKTGKVAEGSVGGGTGMTCYEFKGGIGTSSRKLRKEDGGYIVGVLVQANFGRRYQCTIAGCPVGKQITEHTFKKQEAGSIIVVVATDAPLLPHQCKRIARRVSMGLARTGAIAGNGSGDIFLAFSTANPGAAKPKGTVKIEMLPNERMSALFEATIQATEEAIVNAMVVNEDMIGINDRKVIALPHDKLRAVLKKHNRLEEK